MARSLREQAVLAALGAAALFGLTGAYWAIKAKPQWADARKKLENVKRGYEREADMISQREEWEERYVEEASQIPVVDGAQGADTMWMRVIGEVAKANNVFVKELKPGKIEPMGDMDSVKVDVKWDGALESLVKFMHALESSDEGKFDVFALSLNQTKKQGYLSGSMTLTCIFKR